jgi:NitT/TauT family transport system ATP-binding protein
MAPPAATPALAFERVSKRFDDGTRALAGVDLTVAPGEFVGVVGPSGCGKTTLLRIASGLDRASDGTVARSDHVGYVFQDPTLLPWRTVQGNVELLAELHRLPKQERRRLAEETIRLVGLAEFARHLPYSLSGGMRMRVSLARALTLQPDLFLFDEPFGALDEIARQRLNDELVQLFLARRFAALFVTHSVVEAVFLSSRVVVLSSRPGRVLGSFQVPFGYPRAAELRFAEPFSRLAAEVSACLRQPDGDAEPAPRTERAGPTATPRQGA